MAAFLIAGSLLTGSVAYGDAYYSGTGNTDLIASGLVMHKTYMNGSGFFVKGGYFVTAAHVSNGKEQAFLMLPESLELMKAKLVDYNKVQDLALYKVDGAENHWYLELAESSDASSSFYTYGNGVAQDEFFSKHEGSRIGTNGMYNINYTFGTQAMILDRYSFPAYGGSSGSAVLNDKGKVVGVISAHMDGNDNALVIPLQHLKNFLANNGL